MIVALLLLSVFGAQLFALGRWWFGESTPDPLVLVAAWVALAAPRRVLLPAAVLLGWLRSLVLLEPAGGQVLGACAALALAAFVVRGESQRPWVRAACSVALAWALVTNGAGRLFGVELLAGRELFLGAALALPLGLLSAWRRRRRLRLA